MNEKLQKYEEKMESALKHLNKELASIRAGRANPAILDKVTVDYYGTPTPINQIAAVSVAEARVLAISPCAIERAILTSDIGINPTNDGRVMRLVFPAPTEERRRQLVKDAMHLGEEAKVAVRNIRRDAIDKGKLFNAKDQADFDILFSRVKTEATQDVKVHATHMEDYYKQFTFDDKARMLSVVVHDNLDGDSLFVGHVGVLVPTTDGYLFVEKLTFEEPYQAIKFASKKDCYKYLTTKYKDYTGPGLAKPFIMDNDKWVDMD